MEEDERLDGTAVFTCSVCDDSESQHVRDILSLVFGPNNFGISYLDIVPQELLILYANGRTTGLVVNLGLDITVMGVYEGHLLGETVRRIPMVASEDAFLASAATWERQMRLGTLVAEALEAAPLDTRRDLAANIIVGGGRWGGWPGLRDHLRVSVAELWTSRGRPRLCSMATQRTDLPKVIMPPEAAQSAWIGGSIVGSLGNYRSSHMRDEDEWLASLPSGTRGSCQWKDPMVAVPPDRASQAALRQARAREYVREAPSLCAKLPEELLVIIDDCLGRMLTYPDVPALRTTAYLPPREIVGAAALEERLTRARGLAEQRAACATDTADASPTSLEASTPARLADGVFVQGKGSAHGGSMLAKCFEELASKVASGERWLLPCKPQPGRGYHGQFGQRVGDTMFTRRDIKVDGTPPRVARWLPTFVLT